MATIKKDEEIIKNGSEKAPEVFIEKEVQTQEIEKEDSQKQEIDNQDHQKIRQEIENMDLGDDKKQHVQSDANNLVLQDEEKKLKNLLALAKSKGTVHAVHVAKNMNDPYLLDKFHDLLIEKGYYKEFNK